MSSQHQDGGRGGRPPEGVGWGENTKQAHEDYPEPEPTPRYWNQKPTDAANIRRRFGIAPFENDYHWDPYPNCLIHETRTDNRGTDHVGGTNWLAIGEKGSGKSTWGLYWATRLMEVNDEAVVWRGSPTRSEWLPLKPWTRLFLPASVEANAEWKAKAINASLDDPSADLDDVVREVIYYEDPQDINEQLHAGTFNVVYPDPAFAGCDEIMAESDYMAQPVEWTPKWEADDDNDATPLVHWWFAYCIAKLEYGPYGWVSLIFDETADFAPDNVRADRHESYEKVKALRRVMADSRKFHFSLFFLAHHEENLHSKIRRTIQWRVNMPDGTANPCKENNDRAPVGFNQIPMIHDMLSRRDVGHCIFWNETNFNPITWDDIHEFPKDENRWLKISLSPTHARARGEVTAPTGVSDD